MSRPKATPRRTRSTRPVGVALDAYLGEQLQDREFRDHFDERRLIHDLAIVIRGEADYCRSPQLTS